MSATKKRGPDYRRQRKSERLHTAGTRAAAIAAGAVAVGLVVAFVQDSQRAPLSETVRSAPPQTSAEGDLSIWSARIRGHTFQDCPTCPVMQPIPGGRLVLGLREATYDALDLPPEQAALELPLHWITVEPFAIARHELSRTEFMAFAAETNREPAACENAATNWRAPGFEQTEEDPVVCISWQDARDYAAWLTKQTGARYRLPSEAEWEWAARSGTHDAWFWGPELDVACRFANVAPHQPTGDGVGPTRSFPCEDGFVYTAPAGQLQTNGAGLHHILGNAAEWTASCMTAGYPDELGDSAESCPERVVRGGSWADGPLWVRASARLGVPPSEASSRIGVRLVREPEDADPATPQ